MPHSTHPLLIMKLAKQAVKVVKQAAQKFSNLVRTTGQHMASHKCGYQISTWWRNRKGRLVPRDTSDINEKIQIKDHKGIKTKIKKMNIEETNKGMGFFHKPPRQANG